MFGIDELIHRPGASPHPVGILEAKTAHQYDAHEWGPTGTDDIPPYYRAQCVWYMDTLNLPVTHLAVLIGGSDYRQYEILYVPDEAEWLREEGRRFWEDVKAGNRPSLDAHNATYQAVRAEHPDIERGVDVELDGDVWAEYQATKTTADAATAAHRQAKVTVLDQMGDAQRALVDGIPVLRRQPGRGGAVSLQPIPQPKAGTAA